MVLLARIVFKNHLFEQNITNCLDGNLVEFLKHLETCCGLADSVPILGGFKYVSPEGESFIVRSHDADAFTSFFFVYSSSRESDIKCFAYIEPLECSTNGKAASAPIDCPAVTESLKLDMNLVVQPRDDCSSEDDASDEETFAPPELANLLAPVTIRKRKMYVEELPEVLQGSVSPGRIKYLDLIGAGTSGQVYRALNLIEDQLMAVKCIALDISTESRHQILSELSILHRCSCSNFTVRFLGAFFQDNQVFICTEFMNAGSLDKLGLVPCAIIGPIAFLILQGLNYLWALKVLHRDLKPSNVLLNRIGEVKLCDFGLSAQLVNSLANSYVGTNAYMSPERVLGEPYGVYSDIWSFGLALMEIALGYFPLKHSGDATLKPSDLFERIVSVDLPALDTTQFGLDFPDFVAQCTKRNPKERPTVAGLLNHPFAQKHNSQDNSAQIARWLDSFPSAQSRFNGADIPDFQL